jgi:GNAT superfamily N-acetyltransferase
MTIGFPGDATLAEIAALMPLYMAEAYGVDWHGSEQALRAATADGSLRILAATTGPDACVGFVAWTPSYDLHWCVSGGTILDLYVRQEARGRAVALRLLAAAAVQIRSDGGKFIRGTALDTGPGKQLYGRTAVCTATTECTVSGRAFRQLTKLANVPPREIVRRLPDESWNYEP